MAQFHRRAFLFGLAGATGAAVATAVSDDRANLPTGDTPQPEVATGPQIPLPAGQTPPNLPDPPVPGYANYSGVRA